MLNVALLYNLKREEADAGSPSGGLRGPARQGAAADVEVPPDAQAEYDSQATVDAVAGALRAGGHRVIPIEADAAALDRLRSEPIDIAFNLAEGLRGESRESHLPAVLEMLGIPYTGAGVLALAAALDKPTAKMLFAYHGVATPAFTVIEPGQPARPPTPRPPWFVKPAREGSSMGISPRSLVRSSGDLARQVLSVHRLYRQAALVEEFVGGREFTVSIVGPPGRLRVLPIMEIEFSACPPEHGPIYSLQFKKEWDADRYYRCPAPVGPKLKRRIEEMALKAFSALGCRDVGRVDLRQGRGGRLYVLEVNPLPGLRPAFSDLPRSALAAGISFEELVNLILDAACERVGLRR
ncbi:MAG: hypothetical protein K6T75_11180 [Acetobacteraceae bacterium]|nr:hypothetical protein [Acetobacteraceae bacterium]